MKHNANMGSHKDVARIAIVGATRGVNLLTRYWLPTGRIRPVALCDLDPERARLGHEKLENADARGVRLFDNIASLLAWGEFDAALIATPDHTHASLAHQAFEAGFHCFIEKPMATNTDEASKLVQAWRDSGKIGVVGHEYRYTNMIRAAKRRIEQGDIGTPRLAITVDSCGRMGNYWRRQAWRKSVRPETNSLTLQKAIHQLDIQGYLLGARPTRVFASAGEDHFGGTYPSEHACDRCGEADRCPYEKSKIQVNGIPAAQVHDGLCVFSDDTDLHDNQAVTIEYQSGARGSYVECFFTPDYKFEHTIIGDRGRLVVRARIGAQWHETEISRIVSSTYETTYHDASGGHGGGDNQLAERFADALTTGEPIQPDLLDGYHAVALARAIDGSAHTRQPEDVPPWAGTTDEREGSNDADSMIGASRAG